MKNSESLIDFSQGTDKKSGTKENRPVSKFPCGSESGSSIKEEAIDEHDSLNHWRPQVIFGDTIAICGQLELNLDEVAVAGREQLHSIGETDFVEQLRSGNTSAFDRLIQERSSDVYALLYRLTEDAEEARDLTQETFLQAFRFISQFRGDADLKTWLYRIAINQARNRWRWWHRRRRDRTISLSDYIDQSDVSYDMCLPQNGSDPEQQTLTREREQLLTKALASLRRPFREVIILRDIEGLSYEEVAVTLDINVGTVKSRLARGRMEMRRKLEGAL